VSESVGIVGAGPFGTALANVVARAGRDVVIWSKIESVVAEINDHRTNHQRLPDVEIEGRVRATSDVGELASATRFIVLALGSADVRERARQLGDHLDGSHAVVHAIGAFALPDAVPVSQVLIEELPTLRIGALAGPALVRDLVAGNVSSMVCASRFDEVCRRGRALLAHPPALRIYRNGDLAGVELASAISGVYAVVLGMADALEVGVGTRAVLVTRAVAEASRLGVALGALPRTFSGLSGLGNLLVRGSAGDSTSREYQYGHEMANNAADAERAPLAVKTTHALASLAKRHSCRMPILGALHRVLAGEIQALEAAAAIADSVADVE